MEEVQLNNKQAKQFAKAIYSEIDSYIQKHRDEYEKFLMENERDNNNDIKKGDDNFE